TDEGQLASLGLALYPSSGVGMMAASGMALACRAISEQVTKLEAQALTEQGSKLVMKDAGWLDRLADQLAQVEKEARALDDAILAATAAGDLTKLRELRAKKARLEEQNGLVSRSKWRPLDTLYDMDERNEADEKEAKRLNEVLAPLKAAAEKL